ncbi:MAG: glycosyltransferase family 4 protein [Peptococcaceae bacterium]|nr:glycosyltransferase family 4 protein [Peptococcaceae bacterium]
MRTALVALSVRGAMGQYLEALARPLSERLELHLFVPEHYDGDAGQAILHRFPTGRTRLEALRQFLNPLSAKRIWKELRMVDPEGIHLFNGEGYPWGCLFAYWAKRDDKPFIITIHDPEPHPGNIIELLNAHLRRVTMIKATRIHVHSTHFAGEIAKQGISKQQLHVIPHGSIAGRFTRYLTKEVAREPMVLFFGRLEAYKGLDTLVEAGLMLGGKPKVAIAGPGKLPSNLLKVIHDQSAIFELHNRYLTDEDVARLFQRASVCILPYHQVTQSSVPLIAAAFGVPVVGSALGGFLDDIPRVNGLLVPSGDPRALAQGITKALDLVPYYPRELEFEELSNSFVTMYRSCLSS